MFGLSDKLSLDTYGFILKQLIFEIIQVVSNEIFKPLTEAIIDTKTLKNMSFTIQGQKVKYGLLIYQIITLFPAFAIIYLLFGYK